jgi:hypothetical protein
MIKKLNIAPPGAGVNEEPKRHWPELSGGSRESKTFYIPPLCDLATAFVIPCGSRRLTTKLNKG